MPQMSPPPTGDGILNFTLNFHQDKNDTKTHWDTFTEVHILHIFQFQYLYNVPNTLPNAQKRNITSMNYLWNITKFTS